MDNDIILTNLYLPKNMEINFQNSVQSIQISFHLNATLLLDQRIGIQPHVTLFHFDTPQVLEDEYGGWLSRKIV